MSENPAKSGSSIPSGAGSHPPFAKPVSLDGPETVINPERRGLSSETGAPRAAGGSSLLMRLFPHEASSEGDGAESPVGCRLGHFLIEAAIGSGGMGAVFRAVDERLDRVIALKVLAPALSRDESSVQRFVNEARAAARLDHENIARVYFVGEDKGLHFIAHEFVTGRNLRDMIREHGPLDPREAVNYTLQIATALRHTSAAGVVHRDIKPSNIIINARGRAKLVDLGLAKKVASESFGDLTIAGTTLGTFDYISPEQAKDPRNVDVRSDIYSLGCTLYHMLTGEPPYPEGTVLQKLLDHQARDVPDAARKNPRVSRNLSAVVRRMMAADPRERYATPDDVILDLLPVAAEMGLRGINPEGLVWTSLPVRERSFLERNLAWVAIGAALVFVVFLIDRFPERFRGIHGINDRGRTVAQGDTLREPTIAPRSPAAAAAAGAGASDATGDPGGDDTGANPDASSGASRPKNPPRDKPRTTTAPFDLAPAEPDVVFPDGPPPAVMPPAATSTTGVTQTAAEPPRTTAANATTVSPAPTNNGSDRSDGATASRATSAASQAGGNSAPEISITEGGVATPFASLEAAVAAAKEGNSIELKFNGPRAASEKPFRVSGKRITIRGGKGYRPLITFSSPALFPGGTESRMISLNNGGIDLYDVDIQAAVRETSGSDHWALFSLGGLDRLRLKGVNVAVANPGNRQADLVDVASSRDPLADRMSTRPNGPMGATQEFEVEFEHCFFRGGCTLIAVRTTEGGRLDLKQSAVAVQGALLTNWGDDDSPGDNKRLTVRMEHVTCFVGGGLIVMDSGDVPRYLVPVEVTARNNIFASNSTSPLFSLSGRTTDEEFRRLVHWEGARNFYDRFAGYWTTGSRGAGPSNAPLQFEDWNHLMGDSDVDGNTSGIVWKQSWQGKPFTAITKSDFELASVNQAISYASDGADAGVEVASIRSAPEPPGGD